MNPGNGVPPPVDDARDPRGDLPVLLRGEPPDPGTPDHRRTHLAGPLTAVGAGALAPRPRRALTVLARGAGTQRDDQHQGARGQAGAAQR